VPIPPSWRAPTVWLGSSIPDVTGHDLEPYAWHARDGRRRIRVAESPLRVLGLVRPFAGDCCHDASVPVEDYFVDRATQAWVRATGRPVDFDEHPWLLGPTGGPRVIADEWLQREADRLGGHLREGGGLLGLITDLAGDGFDPSLLAAPIVEFYERTDQWRLEVWSQWSPAAWPFGWILSSVFAHRGSAVIPDGGSSDLSRMNRPVSPRSQSPYDHDRRLTAGIWHFATGPNGSVGRSPSSRSGSSAQCGTTRRRSISGPALSRGQALVRVAVLRLFGGAGS